MLTAGKICLVLVIIAMGTSSMPQQKVIAIHVVNGRDRKPVPDVHLLVTQGASAEEVRQQENHDDLRTNEQGIATLPVDSILDSQIQVRVDFHVLCQKTPNSRSFRVKEIMESGLSTPNDCGSMRAEPGSATFFVFARKPTLWEKMRR